VKLAVTKTSASFESLESRLFFSLTPASAALESAGVHPAIAAAANAGGTGLTGEYFSGGSFATPLVVTNDDNVNFTWVNGRPDPIVPKGVFSARWTGQVEAPVTGTYTFYANADSGTSLTVNGISLFNTLATAATSHNSGAIALVAGTKYSVNLQYVSRGAGAAKVQLAYAAPGLARQVIPASDLFNDSTVALPSSTPLIGYYYLGENFAVPAMERADPAINFNYGKSTPDQVIPSADSFSIRWIGTVVAPQSGTFAVQTISDDGVRLYVNGQLLINDFNDHPAKSDVAKVNLTAGTTYPVRFDYYEDHIYTTAVLAWKLPDGTRSPVPFSKPFVVPAAPVATLASDTASAVGLSWTDVANETGFIVERSTNGGATFTQIGTTAEGVTTFSDTTVSPVTAYQYEIIAVDGPDQSVPSNIVSTTTPTLAPTLLTATVSTPTQINLAWHDVTGETGFIVQKSLDGSTGWTQIGTVAQGVTTFAAAGLTPSTHYYFRVIAVDAGGDSAPSNVANATTSAPNPTYATLTTIYGLTSTGLVYSIDTTTGAVTQIGTLSFGTEAAGRDPYSSNFYYISSSSSTVNISSWNPNSGQNTAVATNVQLSGSVALAAFNSGGFLFIADDQGDLYEFNTDTNVTTLIGNIHVNGSTLVTGNGDIAFAPNGTMFIETGGALFTLSSSAIAGGTGSGSILNGTSVGSTSSAGNLQLAFGENGVLYGTDPSGQLYTVNTTTAATTPVGVSSGTGMNDLASVPLFSDLTVSQTATAFSQGATGSYTFTVANAGPDVNVGAITLVDTLPAGMTFVSGTGNGWTFNVSGQVVTMTYTANLANGASAPQAKLNVAVGTGVAASVTNTVTVSSSVFETNTSNDTSTLTSLVG
jgi:uncharacterized repeat protein (TIGR01451 family)